jgi:hypothetical protein
LDLPFASRRLEGIAENNEEGQSPNELGNLQVSTRTLRGLRSEEQE